MAGKAITGIPFIYRRVCWYGEGGIQQRAISGYGLQDDKFAVQRSGGFDGLKNSD